MLENSPNISTNSAYIIPARLSSVAALAQDDVRWVCGLRLLVELRVAWSLDWEGIM